MQPFGYMELYKERKLGDRYYKIYYRPHDNAVVVEKIQRVWMDGKQIREQTFDFIKKPNWLQVVQMPQIIKSLVNQCWKEVGV